MSRYNTMNTTNGLLCITEVTTEIDQGVLLDVSGDDFEQVYWNPKISS